MSKHLVFISVTVLLVAIIVILLFSNSSLRGDIEALTEALSRPSQSEETLKTNYEELSQQLAELEKEVSRLTARAEPLERLAVNHTARITELVAQIKAHEKKALAASRESDAAAVTTEPLTVIETAADNRIGTQHVLKPGETLQQLAREYYNDQTAWRRILEANKDVVKNTRSMLPGITLFIPDPE